MGSIGKLEVEIEVKSEAGKLWDGIKDSTTLFPKAFPDLFNTIQLLEGDGKSVGSVRLVKLAEGSHVVSSSVEKIEVVDEGNKTAEYSVTGVDIIKYYKSFKAKINVIPKVNGSLVKWSCEYEKASEEIPDPTIVKDFAANIFQRLDAFILNA
ncbi:hypothetical protein LguiA_000274 [Lonicera macranthoides]